MFSMDDQRRASHREADERFKAFMNSASDEFLILDSDLRIIEANQNWLDRAKVTKDIYGTPIHELFPVLKENGRYEAYLKVIKTGNPVEFDKVDAPSGSGLVYNIKAFKVDDGLGLISRNITERVHAEEKIKYINQVLLAIRNVNQLIVTEKDRDKLLQKACDLMVETKGYKYCRIIYTDDSEDVKQVYDTGAVKTDPHTGDNINRYPCYEKLVPDTVTVIDNPQETCGKCPFYSGASGYSVLAMPMNHGGKSYGVFTVAVPVDMIGVDELSLFKEVVGDVSFALYGFELEEERSRAFDAIMQSEKKYQQLLDESMEGITVNILGKLVYMNPRFQEMIGYTKAELLGSSIFDLHAPEYREMIKERTKLRHDLVDVPNYYQVELVRKDGSRLPVSYSVSRIIYDDQPASLTYIHDMSEIKQVSDALAKSEEEYRVLVESAQDVIFKHDLEGNITFVNQRGIDLTGLSREEILSSSVLELIPKEDYEELISRAEKHSAGYSDIVTYRTHLDLQGGSIYFELISSQILKDGEVDEILVIARDITQQVRAEERLTQYRQRLEEMHNYSLILPEIDSVDELIEYTINALQGMLDFEFCDISQPVGDIVHIIKSSRPGKIEEMSIDGPGVVPRAIRTGKTQYVPDVRDDPDYLPGGKVDESGEPYVILSELAVPVKIGDEVKLVLNMERSKVDAFSSEDRTLAEILAAHTASNMQRIQREEAAREAERRAVREQERAEQMIELDEMKTSFIRTATHEIRTPLTSIKGYTQLAQMKIQDIDNPDLDRYFDTILRNTERLEALSTDLLDVQRIESGKLELNKAPASIHDILNDLKLEMKPILDSRDQTLIISSGDYMLNVDMIRMMQVLVNLVMNASKFSPEGSQIKITTEKESDMARISVSDEGVGIKEEDIPKLFKPFPGIKVKGVKDSTGLGLSISKGLVELHGGEIWAESAGLGKGSKFTFTCPCILGEGDE